MLRIVRTLGQNIAVNFRSKPPSTPEKTSDLFKKAVLTGKYSKALKLAQTLNPYIDRITLTKCLERDWNDVINVLLIVEPSLEFFVDQIKSKGVNPEN